MMKRRVRKITKLRNPPPDELSVRILLQRLFDRIVDPRRRAEGGAGLHLNLAVMDAWFVV